MYLTIPAACATAGLGRSSIYDALKAGHVRAVKAGKRTLIETDSLRGWLASLPAYKPTIGAGAA
ncbi:hypothetical protein ABVK25_008768 [Lepraria finkii]|uniref:Helix-turn-helix domain-containing protein n=1 Tax=Lepraria finkii TaxID=1340010 RepID=A0ABR4AZE2_9LECA